MRTRFIDVAVIQSLRRKGEVKDFVAEYGHVIADECHHISAFTFERVMKQVKAKYVLGLTATPARKDGHHPIIFMQCGPMRFHLSARKAAERSPFRHLLLPKRTNFGMQSPASDWTIQDVYAALVTDVARNRQITDDVLEATRQGLTPLVLTNRTEHLERLAQGLSSLENVLVMKGGMGKKQRHAVGEKLKSIPADVPRVILATEAAILAKVSMIPGWTRCFLRCRSLGLARCNNTLVDSTESITANGSCVFMTILIFRFRCSSECTRSD